MVCLIAPLIRFHVINHLLIPVVITTYNTTWQACLTIIAHYEFIFENLMNIIKQLI